MASGAAGETVDESIARFRLFADCGPMNLSVRDLDSEAKTIGLTKNLIQNNVESRLRTARLYDPNSVPYLLVDIAVFHDFFHILIGYNKWVYDQSSHLNYYSLTWRAGFIGSHSGTSGYILENVSQILDQFLVDYLRVNEEACAKR